MSNPPSTASEHHSLWLVPLPSSPLYTTLQQTIHITAPTAYPKTIAPRFPPHVTLTAGTINLRPTETPSEFFERLSWDFPRITRPKVQVNIGELHVGEIFFQKLVLVCEKTRPLCDMAVYARCLYDEGGQKACERWVEENWRPHLSLLYSNLPESDVRANLDEVNAKIQEAKLAHPDSCLSKGAEVWLVPTFKEIKDWKPVAKQELPDIEWIWKT